MTQIASRIDAVKIYVAGATVQRSFTIVPTDGRLPTHVEVAGLPLALEDATVRVRACAVPEGAHVVLSDVRVGLYAPPRGVGLESPDELALETLERRVTQREARRRRLTAEISILERIRVPARPQGEPGKQPPPSPLAARAALEDFVHESITARARLRAEIDAELHRLRESVADLRDKLARASAATKVAAHEVTKTVLVHVRHEGVDVGPVEAVVEYFVPGARWFPQYQIHIDPRSDTATLTMRALVCQNSGEDWGQATLRLSTASPMTFSELPKLAAIRIGKSQAPALSSRGFRPPPVGYAALFGDYDRDRVVAARSVPAPATIPEPELSIAGVREPLADAVLQMASAELADRTVSLGPADGYGGWQGSGGPAFGGGGAPGIGAAAVASAPPPPPPPAVRAPVAAPAPAPRMAPGGPPPAPMRKRAAKVTSREDSWEQEQEEADEGGGGGEPAAPVVSFAALRLGTPTDTGMRNRLQPIDQRARYQESLSRAGLSLSPADLAAIEGAAARAMIPQGIPHGALDFRDAVGAFAWSWETTDRVDVPSDAVYHSVPVVRTSVPCEVRYVTVPREEPLVYRTARIENAGRAPLLPGSVEVYVHDMYVLTSILPLVSPRERFHLGLGVEQRIKCARNTRFSEVRSGQAVVATTELHHTLEIELVNHLERAVHCEVRERIPAPAKDAEVVVEEGHVSPAWEPYTQEERGKALLGGRRWQVELASGEPTVLTAEYVVKIYANNEVVGGNRREA